MTTLTPVDHDPFADAPSAAPGGGVTLTPVDGDPFAATDSAATGGTTTAAPATWGDTAVDVAKSAGTGVVKGYLGLIGLPRTIHKRLASSLRRSAP